MFSTWRRRILLALVTVLVGLSIPVVLELHARSRARSDLEKIIGELDQTDPRWRLEDIEADRQIVPPDKNSADTVIAAERLLLQKWDPRFDDKFWLPIGLDEWQMTFPPPPIALGKEMADKLAAELKPLEPALQISRKLKDLPSGRFPIDYSPDFLSTTLLHQGMLHRVDKLLYLDVLYFLHRNEMVKAWESHRALLNAARSVGDEPLLISAINRFKRDEMIVGSLQRALAQGQLQPSQLVERHGALQKEITEPLFLNGMRGERAGMEHFLSNIESGQISLLRTLDNMGKKKHGDNSSFWDPFNEFFAFSMVLRSHVAFLELQTKVVEALKFPPPKRYEVVKEVGDTIKQMSPDDKTLILTRLLFPSITNVASAEKRAHMRLACAIAGLGAERFRLEKSRWPESLKEVVAAGYLKELPVDVWDGKPLRFRRTKDGLVVYSVGSLLPDYDGTALDDLRNIDFGLNSHRLEFRLWDPAQRRQPPLPAKPKE